MSRLVLFPVVSVVSALISLAFQLLAPDCHAWPAACGWNSVLGQTSS
ncbi:hypothetical protein ACGFNP_33630 [Nonomuraea sp. NPDC049269]